MARHERSAGFICYRRRGVAASGTADVHVPGDVEYLLLDYGRHWEYAKGHVNRGESDLEAAIRELREETGITDVRVVDGFRHELVYFFRDRRKGLIRKTVVFFLGETRASDADVMLSEEHVAFAFLPFDDAVKRVTFAGARQVLRAAHEQLSAVDPREAASSPEAADSILLDPANPPPAGA